MRVRGRRTAAVSSRFLVRVLYVGRIGNVGIYARIIHQREAVNAMETMFFIHRFPFLRRGAPVCAPEGAAPNVSFLSTFGQENNIGTAGLQCKPLL